ncbi:MAG: S-layer homology domain-containing protein, partial [Peptococcaceae bacterium]|nr:S-layer homology domain-containing protein [Peptococcaceae bacterium]
VVTFTDVMDPEAANDVTLTAGSGEIKTAVDVTNTVATISVLETLDYGTEYTLTLDSFKSVNDATALGELTYTFITSDEASDEGTDALDAPEVIANPDDENKFTITGTVKGSTGYGIAGRNVTLVDPDGVDVETVLSGENGAYSFELDMSANNGDAAPAAEGGEGKTIFNYTVKAEYGAEAVAQVRYLTQAVKESIMKAFDDAATAADIHAIFATHSDILGVASYSADCKTLNEHGEFYKDFTDGDGKRNNADLFMKHFIDAEGLNTVYDIPAFYQKALAIEKLNQAVTDANLKNDLTEENCAELGLLTEDSEKLKVAFSVELTREAVDKDKNDNIEYFYTFVMKDTKNKGPSTVINDPENDTAKETFAERLERLAGEWLLSINDVVATDLDLTKASSSVEEATQITIPVTFKDKQPKVTSIELVVSSATAGLVGSASVEMVKLNGSISTPKFDTDNAATATKATFTITMGDNGDVSYTEVASIGLTAPTLASENSSELHNITVSAKVTYHIVTGSEETDLTVPMTGGTVTVTVTEKPASSSNSSSSSSSFGGSSGPAPLVKEEDTEDSNKSLYFFDDMGEALWAQDMVHALVGKGVISKNDQRAFRPMDNISREEVVKMLVTVVGSHNANAKSSLAEVSGDHWATSYIATAQELGIVQG